MDVENENWVQEAMNFNRSNIYIQLESKKSLWKVKSTYRDRDKLIIVISEIL
jgi:hypothetical protein